MPPTQRIRRCVECAYAVPDEIDTYLSVLLHIGLTSHRVIFDEVAARAESCDEDARRTL